MSVLSLHNAFPAPAARAVVVSGAPAPGQTLDVLRREGYQCSEAEDPYAAFAMLVEQGGGVRVLVLSLTAVYREELSVIVACKRRFPHIQIYLANTDGRPAALAEAMRLGADGLLSDDGLHQLPATETAPNVPETRPELPVMRAVAEAPQPQPEMRPMIDMPSGEPVLTAEELRALLQEIPMRPTSGAEGE